MIVPMKKVEVLLSSAHLKEDIDELQNLGVVDIDANYKYVESDDPVLQKFTTICDAINALEQFQEDSLDVQIKDSTDIYEVAKEINTIQMSVLDQLRKKEDIQNKMRIAKKFGSASRDDSVYFQENNVSIKCYKAPPKQKNPFRKNKLKDNNAIQHLYCFFREKEASYWVLLSFSENKDNIDNSFILPNMWKEIEMPQVSYNELTQMEDKLNIEIEKEYTRLKSYTHAKHTLLNVKVELSNELSKIAVVNNGGDKDGIILLQGYMPAKAVIDVLGIAVDNGWGIVIDEPAKDDENVPTLIKNSPPIKIIQPLFKFLDVDPGYREFDISVIFLLFMSLFVGMIIGDAGYGSILLVFSVIAVIKTLRAKKSFTVNHAMFLWFSFVTIAWGSITGNWFGYAPIAKDTVLSYLVFPQFAFYNKESAEAIQLFSFRVGIIQLLLAHLWRCIRVFRTQGILSSVYELAQMSMLTGLFFVVLQLLLGSENYPIPSYGLQLVIGGLIVIILTSEQKRKQNIFVGMLKGISNTITIALDAVAAFADIISYIRLYAVGLASLAIATSFNAMGQGLMEGGSIFAIVGGMATIVLGHSLNLVMAVLAVVVHGVRLNVLEFSGHLGMEWTGRKYNPFKKEKKIISRRI